MKFNVKIQPQSKAKKSPVVAVITWTYDGYNRVRVSTGFSVEADDWDFKFEIPTPNFNQQNKFQLYKKIEELNNHLRQVFVQLDLTGNFSKENFKDELHIATGKMQLKSTLPISICDTIDKLCKQRNLHHETNLTYGKLKQKLKMFSQIHNIKLRWAAFRNAEHELFLDYIQEQNYSENTKWKWQKNFNSVIHYAQDLDFDQVKLRSKSRFKQKAKVKAVIDWNEFKQIENYSPSATLHPNEVKSRKNIHKWLMIMLCTGVRISDIGKVVDSTFRKQDEDGNTYVHFLAQKKVGIEPTEIMLPLLPVIESMVLNEPPVKLSEQKIRDGIKSIMAEIFGKEYTVNVKGRILNLSQEFTAHCSRSSFMTLWLQQLVVPTPLIQSVMGHSVDYGNSTSAGYDGTSAENRAKMFRKCAISTGKMGSDLSKPQVT